MFVLIAGGGRTGAQLARALIKQDHEVHIVDSRKDVLARIHRELPTESIYEGDPMDPEVLERAGIRDAAVLAACTTSDEINLVLCFLGRTKYQTRRTIARINNPRNAWLFEANFHVDVSLNQAEILSHLIEEEMSMGDMMTLLKLRRGNFSLVEEKIPHGATAVGVAIKDLGLPDQCVISAIIRKGEVMIPRGITKFEEGDEVLAVTDLEGAQQLARLLAPPNRMPLVNSNHAHSKNVFDH
jgi:trk system potassium uptake protein TrkA